MSGIDRAPWKRDLTKDPRWEKFGPLGMETRIQALEDGVISDYLPVRDGTFIEDVLGSLFDYRKRKRGPKDWEPRRKDKLYGHDDVVRIMDRMLKNPYEFTTFADLVRDALHFSVEEAVLPGWNDIEFAWDKAVEYVVEHEIVDKGLWDPIMDRLQWDDDEKILFSLSHKMKLGKDYTVTFDASNAKAVKALEKAVYADPENLSERDMEEGLGGEFQHVLDAVVSKFWRILEQDIDDFDVLNRMDFRKWWRETLKNGDMVAAARAEFVEFLGQPEHSE